MDESAFRKETPALKLFLLRITLRDVLSVTKGHFLRYNELSSKCCGHSATV